MNVAGFDFSTKAIDLVLLDENANQAAWHRFTLVGEGAFERTRDVCNKVPGAGWFEEQGVYLIALEKPFHSRGQDMIRLVEGAILASLPRHVQVWEVTPSQWKPYLELPIREKPDARAFPDMRYTSGPNGEPWPQDAYDALGIALWARDVNAAAVARSLEAS